MTLTLGLEAKSRLWIGGILVAMALFWGACADADENRPFLGTLVPLEDLEALLHDDGVGTLIGGRIDAPALESFRRIVDVSFHPLGRFVVILDGDPPFLRAFSPEGALLWASLERGDGPGETRNPRWVSVNEVGILVYGDGRLTWMDAAGRFLGDRAMPDLIVADGGPGCGAGTWMLYGKGRDLQRDSVTWLWEFDPDENTLESRFRAPLVEYGLSSSVEVRLVGGEIRFDHPYGAEPEVLGFDCETSNVRVIAHSALRSQLRGGADDPPGRDGLASVGLTSETLLAHTRLDLSRVVHSAYQFEIIREDSARYTTSLTLWSEGSWRTAQVAGKYVFRDQLPGRLVAIANSDPVPSVRLVPEHLIEESLSPLWRENR